MLYDGKLLIAKGENPCYLLPNMANRHGLIAGATGTGKSTTLKVIAESFSDLGVPVFLADIKGDLSGLCQTGVENERVRSRVESLGLDGHCYRDYPSRFWDVYGEYGHPVRTTVSEMGPLLLSRLLGLSEVQEGVLNIVFRVADDQELLLIDLKDLRTMVNYIGEHNSEFQLEYGSASKQSIGAIQRSLLALEDAGGDVFFGEPALDIAHWMQKNEQGQGVINILHCVKLFQNPLLYSTFLLWLLSELYENLPEMGDMDKPKIVFFFDEAHLLFTDAPKVLLQKVEQVVKLIRSKGVGVYFITQSPSDIPDSVLAQLGNRVQHALRAYTPAEQKAVRVAAQSFRPNPAFKTEEAITALGTGEALVSCLDEKGRPNIVEQATVLPPQSYMGAIEDDRRRYVINNSALYGLYENAIDRESAYEVINEVRQAEQEAAEKEAEEQARAKAASKAGRITYTQSHKVPPRPKTSSSRSSSSRSRSRSLLSKTSSTAANTIGRELGKAATRGLLGLLKK